MFVKDIGKNTISILNNIKISNFKPWGLKHLMSTLDPTNYVLGVGYGYGDHQICISGRVKRSESIFRGANRELYEELSLNFKNIPKPFMISGRNIYYKVNIKDTVLKESYGETDCREDTNTRVVICIYGLESDILDYMDNVRLRPDNCDSITTIWCDKVENIQKLL